MNWCEATLNDFSEITWVLGPAFLQDKTVYTDAQGVAYEPVYKATEAFEMSDMYVEARELLK